MRVLWISPYFFIPPDSGSKLRVYNLWAHLSKAMQISLICFYEKGVQAPPTPEQLAEAKRVSGRVAVFERSRPSQTKLLKFLRAFFYRIPLYVQNFEVHGVQEEIQRSLAEECPLVIQADEIYTAQYLLELRGVYRMLVLHNVDSMVFLRAFLNHPNYFRKLFYLLQFAKMRLYERKVIPRMDRCFCVSGADKVQFDRIFRGKVRFTVLPNGVDTDSIVPAPTSAQKNLLFVGVLRDPQNELAMEWFLTQIFPRILQGAPDATMTVIGAGASDRLRGREKVLPVKFCGYVGNLTEYYASSRIVVAPLQFGSGTKLKILEAMAYGRPVVTTTVGIEGIEGRDGEEVLLADDPTGFAARVLELFNSDQLYDRIVRNARKLVEDRYDWKITAGKLRKAYEEAEVPRH